MTYLQQHVSSARRSPEVTVIDAVPVETTYSVVEPAPLAPARAAGEAWSSSSLSSAGLSRTVSWAWPSRLWGWECLWGCLVWRPLSGSTS